MGLDKDRIIEKDTIIEELICSICTDLVENPVQGKCQHSFCDTCIRQWLNGGKSSCPIDKQRLQLSDLKPARQLNQLLIQFTIRCKYYTAGCKLLVKYDDMCNMVEHETNHYGASVQRENENLRNEIKDLENKLAYKNKEFVEQRQLLSSTFESSPSLSSSGVLNENSRGTPYN